MERVIFPQQVQIGSTTWDKTTGGIVSIEVEETCTPVMDQTGEDLTFQFLAGHSFMNNVTLRVHDTNVFDDVQIFSYGAFTYNFSLPANSSPTQAPVTYTGNGGTAYILNKHKSQSSGSVGELTINLVCQPVVFGGGAI